MSIRLAIVLIHHPVLNKNGETIGSAVTNLDLHDIARAAKTYGAQRYYIATPYTDQQDLVGEIVDHWQTGHGSWYNPSRREALSIVHVVDSLTAAVANATEHWGVRPLIVMTSARLQEQAVSYAQLRDKINSGVPVLLAFGTAHGLAAELMAEGDAILPPIIGGTEYNHLSVRSAASIVLDRLLGS